MSELRVVDSLNESCTCGLRSNFFHIRPMVDGDSSVRLAMDACDQCVASSGVDSNVALCTETVFLAVAGSASRRTGGVRVSGHEDWVWLCSGALEAVKPGAEGDGFARGWVEVRGDAVPAG